MVIGESLRYSQALMETLQGNIIIRDSIAYIKKIFFKITNLTPGAKKRIHNGLYYINLNKNKKKFMQK